MPPTQSINIPPDEKPKNQPVGPTVGIAIIILLLLAGALYFFNEAINHKTTNAPPYIPGDKTTAQ
jgi:hypothetical protein